MGAFFDFWTLESRHPGILESPEFWMVWPISMYKVFFLLSFCQGTWFSIWNSKIPSFLKSSWNYLKLWNASGIGIFLPNLTYLSSIQLYFYYLLWITPQNWKKKYFLGVLDNFLDLGSKKSSRIPKKITFYQFFHQIHNQWQKLSWIDTQFSLGTLLTYVYDFFSLVSNWKNLYFQFFKLS